MVLRRKRWYSVLSMSFIRKIFLTVGGILLPCSLSYANDFKDFFESPEKVGITYAIFSGMLAREENTYTTNLVMFYGATAIGLYNLIELTGDEYSDDDVYEKNKDLFGAFAVTIIASSLFFDDETESVNIHPFSDGTMVTYNRYLK